jgi:hypothetical protein
MRIGRRLERLEGHVNGTHNSPNTELESEEDWLRAWETWGQKGFFDGELDFPFALATFRKAKSGTTPKKCLPLMIAA